MKNLLISIDDGSEYDLDTINLLNRFYIRGIFFIPIMSWGFENLYMYDRHIVGAHTVNHPPDLKRLSYKDKQNEIVYSKELLEEKLDYKIEWFAYPRGRFDEETKLIVDSNFKYDRGTRGYDPLGNKLVHIHPDSGANGNRPWRECVPEDKIHLWGHSEEFNRWNMYDEIEECLDDLLS